MMTAQEVTAYALDLPEVTEDHPFGFTPDVYRVQGKIFALLMPERVSLKCEPGLAQLVREKYEGITPGYHLNKRHWNTVELDGSVPDEEVREMIVHSYEQVVAKLPKSDALRLQRELEKLPNHPL